MAIHTTGMEDSQEIRTLDAALLLLRKRLHERFREDLEAGQYEKFARDIDARIDAMVTAGLIEETRRLAQKYDWSLPSMSGLGYRQIGTYLRGECNRDDAIAAIRRASR